MYTLVVTNTRPSRHESAGVVIQARRTRRDVLLSLPFRAELLHAFTFQALADQHNIKFFETSAKNNINVRASVASWRVHRCAALEAAPRVGG